MEKQVSIPVNPTRRHLLGAAALTVAALQLSEIAPVMAAGLETWPLSICAPVTPGPALVTKTPLPVGAPIHTAEPSVESLLGAVDRGLELRHAIHGQE